MVGAGETHVPLSPAVYEENVKSVRPLFLSLPALSLLASLLLTGCGISGRPGPAAPTPDAAACRPAGALSFPGAGAGTSQEPANWAAPHVPGEVLVVTGRSLSAQAVSALSGVSTLTLADGLLLAQTPAGEQDAAFAQRLTRAGLRTQPNYRYFSLAPNDPGFPGNRGVRVGDPLYQQTYLTRIGAGEAWQALDAAGRSKNGVLTAVLDTGADGGHPDLAGRLLTGCTFDNRGGFAVGAPEVSASSSQGRGHGTGSAGLIGATTDNGLGLSGLLWRGALLPVKVLGEDGASTVSLVGGLNYAAAQGARVINMSLGIAGRLTDPVLDRAITAAARQAVLVAAAGNTSGDGIYFPASHPDVIAVGALGREDRLACYSARPGTASGTRQLDIVAPGGNAGTRDGVTSSGPGCLISGPDDLLTLSAADQSGYALRAGTSEAAPLVSGVVSLMWGANPDLSAAEVRARLLASARPVDGLKVLDARAAVEAALR